MTAQLDWGKLVSQGRANAPGISWTDEEGVAIAKIAQTTGKTMAEIAPYIRQGILTVEGYLKAKDKPGIVNPFLKLTKDALLKKAQVLNLPVSPDASKEVIADLLLDNRNKEAEAKKKADAEAKIREKTEAEAKAKAEAEAKAKADADAKKKTETKAKPKAPAKKPASKPKAKPAKKAGKR